MKKKIMLCIVLVLVLFSGVLVVSYHISCSKKERIVCFVEDTRFWEGNRYCFLYKGNFIIAQELKKGEKANYYLYQENNSSQQDILYKYIDSKGDLDHAVSELAYWRFDLFIGGDKPYNCEYFNNDNFQVADWFKEVRSIVCTEENKIDVQQLPEFIKESEWCSRVFLEKAKSD